jgi:hypothetical protein
MTGFASPEEAARDGLREEYVRVVGVAVRGDEAVVAQVMNADGYPEAYEIETAKCSRGDDGWLCGSDGNSNLAWIAAGEDSGTVVWWDEAPTGVEAAHIRLGGQDQTVPVEDGFFFAVFDDVPKEVFRPYGPSFGEWPKLVKWISPEHRSPK